MVISPRFWQFRPRLAEWLHLFGLALRNKECYLSVYTLCSSQSTHRCSWIKEAFHQEFGAWAQEQKPTCFCQDRSHKNSFWLWTRRKPFESLWKILENFCDFWRIEKVFDWKIWVINKSCTFVWNSWKFSFPAGDILYSNFAFLPSKAILRSLYIKQFEIYNSPLCNFLRKLTVLWGALV